MLKKIFLLLFMFSLICLLIVILSPTPLPSFSSVKIEKLLVSAFQEEDDFLIDALPESFVRFDIKKGDSFLKCVARTEYSLPSEFYQHFNKKKPVEAKKFLSQLQVGDSLFCSVFQNNEIHSVKLNSASFGEIEIDLKTFEIKKALEEDLYHEYYFHQAEVQNNITLDLKRENLPHKVIEKIIEVFSWDLDWQRQIRPNTQISILYTDSYQLFEDQHCYTPLQMTIDIPGDKKYEAFYDSKRKIYVDSEGKSLKKGFMRNPVVFDRISSKFHKGRKHPILHTIRAHKGVDYAAKIGTGVRATADGKVLFAGKKGGYGNVIELKHGKRYVTVYAHLNTIAKKVKKGSSVSQGQLIGTVGMTGLATGPHLHYEFRVDNVHQDPLTVSLPAQKILSPEEREELKVYQKKYLFLIENSVKSINFLFL